jgi:hypothetical protein
MNVRPPLCLAALLLSAASFAASAQTFVCGGVGLDEQQRIKAEAGSHDLMLTFATSSGAYMADVAVRIQDRRGATVLDARCDGPILLADLPGPGTYRVTATAAGASRQRSVSVARGKRPAKATFIWPAGAD